MGGKSITMAKQKSLRNGIALLYMKAHYTAIIIKRVDFDTEKANKSTEQNLKVQKKTNVIKEMCLNKSGHFNSPQNA